MTSYPASAPSLANCSPDSPTWAPSFQNPRVKCTQFPNSQPLTHSLTSRNHQQTPSHHTTPFSMQPKAHKTKNQNHKDKQHQRKKSSTHPITPIASVITIRFTVEVIHHHSPALPSFCWKPKEYSRSLVECCQNGWGSVVHGSIKK